MHPILFDSRQKGTRQSFKALLSRSTLLFARIVSAEINTTQKRQKKKEKKKNCIQKKKREKNICITIYVLIYFFCRNEILGNSPASTKRPGRNTQHLYLNQYMPPRRRTGIRCNFQTTSSTISQKPPEENLRDQV
jgi:hypothetical protein